MEETELVKYTLQKDGTNNYLLKINGSQSTCPFQNNTPTQTNIGGLAFIKHGCSTQCPLAMLQVTAQGQEYYTHCGSETRRMQISPEEEQLPATKSILSSV